MTTEKPNFSSEQDDQENKIFDLKERLHKINAQDRLGVNQKIFSFVDSLQKSHPDFLQYKLYHVLIVSTPPAELPKFDFPGEDAVEKFIESLEAEYFGRSGEEEAPDANDLK